MPKVYVLDSWLDEDTFDTSKISKLLGNGMIYYTRYYIHIHNLMYMQAAGGGGVPYVTYTQTLDDTNLGFRYHLDYHVA